MQKMKKNRLREFKSRFPLLWGEFIRCIVCQEYYKGFFDLEYGTRNAKITKLSMYEMIINMAMWIAKVDMFAGFFNVILSKAETT